MTRQPVYRVRRSTLERSAQVHIWEPSAGAAPEATVLYLHGLGAYTGGHAREFAEVLLTLGAYRIISPDMPGYGGSPALAFDDYGPTELGDWLQRNVLDETDEPVHVVGHSWGAETACHLVADRPGLVRTAVLLDAGHQDWGPITVQEALDDAIAFDQQCRFSSVEEFLRSAEPMVLRTSAVLREAYRSALFEQDGAVLLRQRPETYAAVRVAAARFPVSATWSRIGDVPMLLVLAADAQVKPFRPDAMAAQVADLSLRIVEDCTHFVIDDAGPRLPELLVPFWEGKRYPMPDSLATPDGVTDE